MREMRFRLRLGPLVLVQAPRGADGQRRWAVPGGALATYRELADYARQRGWPRPVTVSTETDKRGKA